MPYSTWIQQLTFHNIYMFWSDGCPFFHRVGVELFFEHCYWRG